MQVGVPEHSSGEHKKSKEERHIEEEHKVKDPTHGMTHEMFPEAVRAIHMHAEKAGRGGGRERETWMNGTKTYTSGK